MQLQAPVAGDERPWLQLCLFLASRGNTCKASEDTVTWLSCWEAPTIRNVLCLTRACTRFPCMKQAYG